MSMKYKIVAFVIGFAVIAVLMSMSGCATTGSTITDRDALEITIKSA